MGKCIIIFVACLCSVSAAYAAALGRQGGNYHYIPPQGQRLELPQHSADNSQDYQPQQQRTYRQQYSQQQQRSSPLTMALTSQGYGNAETLLTDQSSQDSVRLPLPLGVASINVGPLPLSEGIQYSARPGITSYGTPYPQRV